MTPTTTTRVWTQGPSGDWYTDGANGRRYRWHPLSGLHATDPGRRGEFAVPTAPGYCSAPDAITSSVERAEREDPAELLSDEDLARRRLRWSLVDARMQLDYRLIGFYARRLGESFLSNPYPVHVPAHVQWAKGWQQADQEAS